MRVGIVAEGTTDFLVIEAVVRAIEPDVEFVRIWPDTTMVGLRPYGWRGVKAWCQENAGRIEVFLRGIKGKEIDVLVIHSDCSMADKVNARHPCPPARKTADALRAVILTEWLARAECPPWLVPLAPAQASDAWVVAALVPPYAEMDRIECATDVEGELVRRRKLRRRDDEVKKPVRLYAPLVETMASRLADVRCACREANRFCEELTAARAAVAGGLWERG
jgi:hypothetical protein